MLQHSCLQHASKPRLHCAGTTLQQMQCRLSARHCTSGPGLWHQRPGHHKRRRTAPCQSSGEDTSQSSEGSDSGSSMSKAEASRIVETLAGLDALLGIPPEDKQKEDGTSAKASDNGSSAPGPELSVSPEVLNALADVEMARSGKEGKEKDKETAKQDLLSSMNTIVEQARLLQEAKRQGKSGNKMEQKITTVVSQLLASSATIPREDVAVMKEKVFGPKTFWVTETRAADVGFLEGSLVVRGNLRAPREEVLTTVDRELKAAFKDKYEVFMTEDPEVLEEDTQAEPRVAFLVVPAIFASPKPTARWQYAVVALLTFFTLGTATQLGILANISKLPKETISWLLQPDSFTADALPPGLQDFDPIPLLLSALPVSGAVMATQLAHEIAHRVAAQMKQIKLGPAFFIPNNQIGSFGAITQFKSLVRNNRDMFDVTASGVAAALLVSMAAFGLGLSWSTGADVPRDVLVPVPTALFQGSLLLGRLSSAVLGSEMRGPASSVMVHPLLIGGWCGLVSTALNCLPVGRIDGGRMMQATFGNKVLAITSFFTYLGLGLGFLGSNLALPFGLFVLICQRDPEVITQDQVNQAESRRGLSIAAAVISVLVLLPNISAIVDGVNVGPPGTFL